MLALAVTIHNLPEGMAVGVVFAGAENGAPHISLAAAISVSLGIAIQNIPEGAIISMPMRAAGNSRWRSFVLGSLSGVVEPIGAIAVLLLASLIMPALPYMLAFAAGAMFYVVVEELIPEASSGQHSNLSTIGFAIGFVLILDVVMGKKRKIITRENNNKTEISQLLVKYYQQMALKTSKQLQNRYLCGVNDTSIIHTP